MRLHLAATGDPVPYGAHFWVGAKEGTMFQAVHQGTAYRFALKVIEAREAWIDDNDTEQIIRQAPYQCQTARAVDRFCGIVAAAGVMHGQQASTLAAHMIGDVADQVHEVDTALEVQIMVEEDDDYKVKSEEGEVCCRLLLSTTPSLTPSSLLLMLAGMKRRGLLRVALRMRRWLMPMLEVTATSLPSWPRRMRRMPRRRT